MTSTPPTSPTPSPYPSAGGYVPPDTGRDMDRDAFLTLLVTQLSNQDPMNPQEGHEFAAQLAQFSSVEQLGLISETLGAHTQLLGALGATLDATGAQQEAMAQALTARGDLAAAAGLVGQTVEAVGDHAVWNGTDPVALGFELPEPASSVRVVVRNEAGEAVRTLDLGHLGSGRHLPGWDGLDDGGAPVPEGTYTFSVEAEGSDGEDVEATTFTRGHVDRVTIEPDGITLWLGGLAVPMADLLGVAS